MSPRHCCTPGIMHMLVNTVRYLEETVARIRADCAAVRWLSMADVTEEVVFAIKRVPVYKSMSTASRPSCPALNAVKQCCLL